jgi:endonuclease/exonuclease/phosphatase family metal-dependent hydrolase
MLTLVTIGGVCTLALTGLLLASRRRPVAASMGGQSRETVSAPDVRAAAPIRVGCYNIHRSRGLDGRRDINRIAATIGDADLAGLCEVEGSWYGVIGSQPQQLAGALGVNWLFSPTRRRWMRHDRGNGVLSRYPIQQWINEPLVDSTGRRGRALTTAKIRVGDQTVVVLVTHLSRRLDQEIQLRTVLERFVQYDRAILIGDFNVSRSFTLLRRFLASGAAVDAIGNSLGEEDDPTRIDWILTRGLQVLGGGSTDIGPSDHPYYWVDITLTNTTPQGADVWPLS